MNLPTQFDASANTKVERCTRHKTAAVLGYFLVPAILPEMSIVFYCVPHQNSQLLDSEFVKLLKAHSGTDIGINDDFIERVEEMHVTIFNQLS